MAQVDPPWLRRFGDYVDAFGAFTGLAQVSPEPDDRVFVEAENGVAAIIVGSQCAIRSEGA